MKCVHVTKRNTDRDRASEGYRDFLYLSEKEREGGREIKREIGKEKTQ